MSIVVALEHPRVGPPWLYMIEPGDEGGESSRPEPIDEQRMAALEERVRRLREEPEPELLRQIGEDLLALLSIHPDIAAAIRRKLDLLHPHEEPIYVYFKHRIEDLERWPWEVLYAPNVGFVSQNRNFAIARSQCCSNGKTEWSFEPPLRILAVLGASGDTPSTRIEGDDQWQGLYEAARKAREGKLPVELRILTCQRKLVNTINRLHLDWAAADLIPPSKPACAGARLPDVSAGLAPRDLLFEYIKDYAPHILHFFSHATAEPLPQLQVGTYSDWERETLGSILIDGVQLKQRVDKEGKIWMVTLNCCQTAMDGPEQGSLSMSVAAVLARQGIPAVVGMRELVPGTFANAFSHLFYGTLLEDLRSRIAKVPTAGGLVDIHWACGLFAVRQRVADNSANQLEWTLPVMHTAYDFKLMVKAPPTRPNASCPRAARKPKQLTRKKLEELEDELLQLHEDRKLIIDNKPVVKVIDKRIATINRQLSQAQGGSHARTSSRGAAGSQRL